MKKLKNQSGITLMTLVITIVVILILTTIGYTASKNTVDEAISAKFKQEYAEVVKGVKNIILINSKEGLSEENLNKGFKKVKVENAPSEFVSFDEDKVSGYLVDLKLIDYEKVKTGQDYKKLKEEDTVKFSEDDVYIYDKDNKVYYVKGIYIAKEGICYTVDE